MHNFCITNHETIANDLVILVNFEVHLSNNLSRESLKTQLIRFKYHYTHVLKKQTLISINNAKAPKTQAIIIPDNSPENIYVILISKCLKWSKFT